ncbi:MAG TPA: hypothetical protein VFC14_22640 [Burkholderiales bacterium]|jgi:hypothetical protein|nr:hypothetical protein [Burkholderiales bacterium]
MAMLNSMSREKATRHQLGSSIGEQVIMLALAAVGERRHPTACGKGPARHPV